MILHCSILHCTILSFTRLYHIVSFYTILYSTRHDSVLSYQLKASAKRMLIRQILLVSYAVLLPALTGQVATHLCAGFLRMACKILMATLDSLYSTTQHFSVMIIYSMILYHTILYYTLLYSTMLYYTILYYTILYYTILYYTILYYTILYYTILYYTILYYTILYYTMPCYCV